MFQDVIIPESGSVCPKKPLPLISVSTGCSSHIILFEEGISELCYKHGVYFHFLWSSLPVRFLQLQMINFTDSGSRFKSPLNYFPVLIGDKLINSKLVFISEVWKNTAVFGVT